MATDIVGEPSISVVTGRIQLGDGSSLHRCGINLQLPTNQPTSYQPAISCEKRGEIPGFSDRHLMIFQHNSSSAQASCMLRHAEARALWNGADLSI